MKPMDGLHYGSLSVALAFLALPLYVLLPNHYARHHGLDLASLGFLLLGVRVLDAMVDPLLGRWLDQRFDHGVSSVMRLMTLSALLLALGLAALLFPQAAGPALIGWLVVSLVVTCLAYSTLTIAHQSWGTRLGGDDIQRTQVSVWREAPGLLGVLLASVLPVLAGLTALWAAFASLLALGLFALRRAPQPAQGVALMGLPNGLWRAWHNPRFRSLAWVFAVNGVATAIPASLVLFFAQDVLQAPPFMEAVFLCAYFLAGAAAMPLWMRAIRRWGLPQSWLSSMVLAICVFATAASLSAGDATPFVFICLLSGVCLGADLAIPGALLTGCIQAQGDEDRHEGSYIGWWHFFNKLNLALAAGLALPLLQTQAYVPGQRGPQALDALVLAYCVVPCILKSIAAVSLAVHVRRQTFA